MLLLIVTMVNMLACTVEMSGLHFYFINTRQRGFSFFVFQVLIEQVLIDLKNPYVNSGCWALTPYHGG